MRDKEQQLPLAKALGWRVIEGGQSSEQDRPPDARKYVGVVRTFVWRKLLDALLRLKKPSGPGGGKAA
jgi:hypothetical protein